MRPYRAELRREVLEIFVEASRMPVSYRKAGTFTEAFDVDSAIDHSGRAVSVLQPSTPRGYRR